MISIHDAVSTIVNSVSALDRIEIPIDEAAGYVLADDVVAIDNVPLAANSAMDGFAVRAIDLERAPVGLRIAGEVFAGRAKEMPGVAHGTCVRIMTGAIVPSGADAVVPQEGVKVEGETLRVGKTARFEEPVNVGDHIRPMGEDMRAGETVLPRGAELTPAALAVAVTAGRGSVFVVRRPKVAIFTSGDELVAPGEPVMPGLVRNSNSIAIAAHLRKLGCEVIDLGIARDNRSEIAEGLGIARRADVLITSGGVSVGERDMMRAVLEEQGLKTKFWKVNVKPGKPVLFGMLDRTVVFGLPGNPVSTQVTFELFARPALRKMMGHARLFRPVIAVTVGMDIRHSPGRPEFMRVKIEDDIAMPTRSQGSALTTSVLDADGLLYVEAETIMIPQGASAPCLVLDRKEVEDFALSI